MKRQINKTLLEIVSGDITERDEDAIVNPANPELVLGGGVAGAIREKGGAIIQAECRKKGPVHVGEAIITSAGNLKASFVIHAVGPRWGEGNEDEKLRMAVYRTLRVADQNGLRSLALPAISTGIFGYPKGPGCRVIVAAVARHLDGPVGSVTLVRLVSIDEETASHFLGALSHL